MSPILTVIGFVGPVLFVLILLAGWLWQTYDAYQTAKIYNDLARRSGRAPW